MRKLLKFCLVPTGYQIDKQDAAYFMTMTAVECVDVFSRNEFKYLLIESLNYCVKEKGLEIFAYVIMSSHLHMVARAECSNLSNVVRDFKKFTSGSILNEIKNGRESRNGWMFDIFGKGGEKQKKKSDQQLWQYNKHAEEVYSPKFMLTKINYIHNNPVEAGLVERPEEYIFSSAGNYAGRKWPVDFQ